jgi:AcrR family transcriptional regulator
MTAAATPRRPISEDAFLDAATELFAQQGYGATSVDQIALRAGSTKPTFYARFASKEELYARAVEREASLLTSYLFAAYDRAEREGLREGVSLGMRAAFEFAQERPGGTALLFEPDMSAPSGEVSERAVRQVIRRVAQIMRPILAGDDAGGLAGAELLAALMVSLSNAGIRHARRRGIRDLDAVGEAVASFAVEGVTGLDRALFAAIEERPRRKAVALSPAGRRPSRRGASRGTS